MNCYITIHCSVDNFPTKTMESSFKDKYHQNQIDERSCSGEYIIMVENHDILSKYYYN